MTGDKEEQSSFRSKKAMSFETYKHRNPDEIHTDVLFEARTSCYKVLCFWVHKKKFFPYFYSFIFHCPFLKLFSLTNLQLDTFLLRLEMPSMLVWRKNRTRNQLKLRLWDSCIHQTAKLRGLSMLSHAELHG